jgi:predicted dinucleotide-binding enzyme
MACDGNNRLAAVQCKSVVPENEFVHAYVNTLSTDLTAKVRARSRDCIACCNTAAAVRLLYAVAL